MFGHVIIIVLFSKGVVLIANLVCDQASFVAVAGYICACPGCAKYDVTCMLLIPERFLSLVLGHIQFVLSVCKIVAVGAIRAHLV